MLRVLLLVATGISAALAGSQEATADNFDSIVINSGKNSLVKFLAPWFAFIVVWHMEHSAALIV